MADPRPVSVARRIEGAVLRRTGWLRPEVVVFDLTHRCNSRCRGCAFREPEPGELGIDRWEALAAEAAALGFGELALTGGEPLAHPEIGELLPRLARHVPVSLMTNGLALRKHAELVRAHAHAVYVSVDAASEATYARIRGVHGLGAVREGIRALRGARLHARVTVWAENVDELPRILAAARDDGCTAVSFLPCDTSSEGFGERDTDRGTRPRPEQFAAIRSFFETVADDPLVAMSAYGRDRVVLLATGGREPARCLAPWTSGVVDPTGSWRHCFFLGTTTHTRDGLGAAIRAARPERRRLDVTTEPACAACVCWRG